MDTVHLATAAPPVVVGTLEEADSVAKSSADEEDNARDLDETQELRMVELLPEDYEALTARATANAEANADLVAYVESLVASGQAFLEALDRPAVLTKQRLSQGLRQAPVDSDGLGHRRHPIH